MHCLILLLSPLNYLEFIFFQYNALTEQGYYL